MAPSVRLDVPVSERMRMLFALKHDAAVQGDAEKEPAEAVCAAMAALTQYLEQDPSVLVRHEAAYVLGQSRNPLALPILEKVLQDGREHPMVRHEAAEAMGAIGDDSSLDVLRRFCEDEAMEVAQTCQLAIRTITESKENSEAGVVVSHGYTSVDPARGRAHGRSTSELGHRLMDASLSMFERYEAMFALRNRGGKEAVLALAQGLDRTKESSALFRHEIAYVFGQMQDPESCEALESTLKDLGENEMVRHEAAEALGSISTERCRMVLSEFLKDSADVVRESCEVALDIADYNNSDAFDYAIASSAGR